MRTSFPKVKSIVSGTLARSLDKEAPGLTKSPAEWQRRLNNTVLELQNLV